MSTKPCIIGMSCLCLCLPSVFSLDIFLSSRLPLSGWILLRYLPYIYQRSACVLLSCSDVATTHLTSAPDRGEFSVSNVKDRPSIWSG